MQTPRNNEQEVLLALYRYTMLTVDQLCVLLHYQPDSMYQTLGKMRKRNWVNPCAWPFCATT
ncbi:MAG: MarR family transcriptional regulator [Bacilli bacterium]